jgi:hypothetical protein
LWTSRAIGSRLTTGPPYSAVNMMPFFVMDHLSQRLNEHR